MTTGASREAYIGLGANLGDAPATLAAALAAIAGLPGTRVCDASSVYRSAPVDAQGPDFHNQVARIETALAPGELLAALQRIEQAHGRQRPYRNAPRTLDLDLLLYGDAVLATEALTLPHPRLHQRAFVLVPLAEIAPGLVLPAGLGPIVGWLAGVGSQPLERIDGTRPLAASAGARRWRHIAIEGPVGVGKTTLARLLAVRLGAELLLEQPDENPFLAKFYAEGRGYAFQTQLFFLFQRIDQYRALAEPGMFTPRIVSDFMFAKDRLFARLTLSEAEYALYDKIQAQAARPVPEPDLVLWLRAGTPALMERIQRRGRPIEREIEADYLERIAQAYGEFFIRHPALPVLAVDTEHFDPRGRPAHLDRLLAALASFRGPRETLETTPTIPLDDVLMTDR